MTKLIGQILWGTFAGIAIGTLIAGLLVFWQSTLTSILAFGVAYLFDRITSKKTGSYRTNGAITQ